MQNNLCDNSTSAKRNRSSDPHVYVGGSCVVYNPATLHTQFRQNSITANESAVVLLGVAPGKENAFTLDTHFKRAGIVVKVCLHNRTPSSQ